MARMIRWPRGTKEKRGRPFDLPLECPTCDTLVPVVRHPMAAVGAVGRLSPTQSSGDCVARCPRYEHPDREAVQSLLQDEPVWSRPEEPNRALVSIYRTRRACQRDARAD